MKIDTPNINSPESNIDGLEGVVQVADDGGGVKTKNGLMCMILRPTK